MEVQASEQISEHKGKPVFACLAATNIDRLVTLYRATIPSNRIFLEDLYTATIAMAAGERIPNPMTFTKVRVFQTSGEEYQHRLLQDYGYARIGKRGIVQEPFVMCVRPSMKNYLEKLSKICDFNGGLLFYSMWNGYKQSESIKDFFQFMESKGVTIKDLHTSGHADTYALQSLIVRTEPKYIIPVHTENASWFEWFINREVGGGCVVTYDSKLKI
ncbi:MAG: MBL fold metallo-hydrolase RNA specificity domain-containing protein [Phascolarctobacterium sp.]